jgi:hypothetical protein
MTSRDSSTSTATLDCLPVLLDTLSSLAATVLGDHTDAAGLCAICGTAWPCERVTTAAHNLAVL